MVENYKADPTLTGWQFKRIFGGPDYSDGSPMMTSSLSLALGYLSIYKILDNILPLSGTDSADLASAGPLEKSVDQFTPEKPKQWELKVNDIAYPPQPLESRADILLVSTSEKGKHPSEKPCQLANYAP